MTDAPALPVEPSLRASVVALRTDAVTAWQRRDPDALVTIAAIDRVIAIFDAHDAAYETARRDRAAWLDANPYALP